MTWVDAAAFTPEINYQLMTTGDMGASLTAAGAAHQSLADMLIAEMTQMGFNTSSTAAVSWQGPGGQMMVMSAGEFITILEAASLWIQTASQQALEVVSAHQAAVQAMIPSAVSISNRVTQGGLVGTNWFGQNTPGINALDAQYAGFWINNAGQRSVFGSVVSMALGLLSTPAPLSPTAPDPAGPAVGVVQAAGQAGAQGGLQLAGQTMTQAADAPVAGGTATGTPAQSVMYSMIGSAGSLAGQAGSAVQPFMQVANAFPQLASQGPSLLSSMLGPLSSAGTGVGATDAAAALGPSAAAAAPALAGGALAGGGGAGGGGLLSASAMGSTFVRPASSFSEPTAPKLPGGWQEAAAAVEPAPAQPSAVGGGGLYGAPAALGREGSAGAERSAPKTMQVTARSAAGRGEQHRN
ncbi:MAG: PPE family protein [Mycobacterium sp.]|nr:PPE family protein [Mycobacterium sp.]MBV9722486.1 PPE family protein [Mycobacterium sp.]